jgi:hypothetical protein
MNLWHASYELRQATLAVVAKSVRLAAEAGTSGLGLDTSG